PEDARIPRNPSMDAGGAGVDATEAAHAPGGRGPRCRSSRKPVGELAAGEEATPESGQPAHRRGAVRLGVAGLPLGLLSPPVTTSGIVRATTAGDPRWGPDVACPTAASSAACVVRLRPAGLRNARSVHTERGAPVLVPGSRGAHDRCRTTLEAGRP